MAGRLHESSFKHFSFIFTVHDNLQNGHVESCDTYCAIHGGGTCVSAGADPNEDCEILVHFECSASVEYTGPNMICICRLLRELSICEEISNMCRLEQDVVLCEEAADRCTFYVDFDGWDHGGNNGEAFCAANGGKCLRAAADTDRCDNIQNERFWPSANVQSAG